MYSRSTNCLAIQEILRPFKDGYENDDSHSFFTLASSTTYNLKVSVATVGSGYTSTSLEYPSIVYDPSVVTLVDGVEGQGYVKHTALLFDEHNTSMPYARVPYFWRFKVNANHAEFIVVSVHLTPSTHSLHFAARLKCLKLLTKEDRWGSHVDVFFVGDFNKHTYDNEFNLALEKNGFRSLLPDGVKTNVLGTEPYDHIIVESKQNPGNGFEVINLKAEITEQLTHEPPNSARYNELNAMLRLNDTGFNKILSDHNPVFVVYFGWKNNKLKSRFK